MATSEEPSVSHSTTFNANNGSSSLKRKRPPSIEIPNVLAEIRENLTPRNDEVSFGGVGVGVFSRKGKKKFMEDTHKIASFSQDNANKVK